MRLIIILLLASCTSSKVPNISTPSKREIRKAMKHSDWRYSQPTYKMYKQ